MPQRTRLRKEIDRKPVALELLFELGVKIAGALDTAHVRGVVHPDIKPANIIVSDRRHARILSFVQAKRDAAKR